ncbi:hypothetical protein [Amycolatopsis saalfeldensis]|uniref:Uncharacterized protein n=1 Tax=Amycolatopsis saalfeldensis TaxID=394193 RepID=A0A1H8YNN7_9PSEU|nr:hypothetical protein [Amycolatopsis saalfeldensis]SEP53759.1 hypothetical protein SAMN04489732_13061 [Amycolatopsis saalfeldensis]
MIRLRHRLAAKEILMHVCAFAALGIAIDLVVTEPDVVSVICLALTLGLVAWLLVRYRRDFRFGAGKELKALYAELERINEQHPDGAELVLDREGGRDVIINHVGEIGGFVRALPVDEADLDVLLAERFWLFPHRGRVIRHVSAIRVGRTEDGSPVPVDAFDTPPIGGARGLSLLRDRTGVDLATAVELRDLLGALQRARVTEDPLG